MAWQIIPGHGYYQITSMYQVPHEEIIEWNNVQPLEIGLEPGKTGTKKNIYIYLFFLWGGGGGGGGGGGITPLINCI